MTTSKGAQDDIFFNCRLLRYVWRDGLAPNFGRDDKFIGTQSFIVTALVAGFFFYERLIGRGVEEFVHFGRVR